MELTNYQKLWRPCPECGATATILNTWGGQYAGIWECINPECGVSDSCEHEATHIETTEDWPTGPEDNPQEYEIYVCDDCECAIDLDVANPAVDREDALADSQIDEARGK